MKYNGWISSRYLVGITLLLLLIYVLSNTFLNQNTSLYHGCSEYVSKYLEHKNDNNHRITYCKYADKDTIKIYSDFLRGDPNDYIIFDYIGYPKQKGIALYLEDERGQSFPIEKVNNSAALWQTIVMHIPKNTYGKIRVVAEDNEPKNRSCPDEIS